MPNSVTPYHGPEAFWSGVLRRQQMEYRGWQFDDPMTYTQLATPNYQHKRVLNRTTSDCRTVSQYQITKIFSLVSSNERTEFIPGPVHPRRTENLRGLQTHHLRVEVVKGILSSWTELVCADAEKWETIFAGINNYLAVARNRCMGKWCGMMFAGWWTTFVHGFASRECPTAELPHCCISP